MHYYEVAPTIISRRNIATYTYCSESYIDIGALVHITIGSKSLHGVVIEKVDQPAYATKPIVSIHDTPPLPIALVKTALWMAEYYVTPLATILQSILPRGLDTARRARPLSTPEAIRDRTNFVFTDTQRHALHQIESASPGSILLHGVTGSGKTAVYIELARQAIARGRSAIILVPEIALTSQIVDEFSHHFPDVIVTHSRQTEAARHQQWLTAICSTTPRIVIGPRSALFMPLKNIGLIIIDECHEPSYKQDQAPRYYTPRVASVLGMQHGAKVIYGSATPPISEYYLATLQNRPIVQMRESARSVVPPQIELVDMSARHGFRMNHLISDSLISSIQQSRERHHQALLFHNRRGSASTTLCEECGWMDMCERCALPRTLHIDQHLLRCHVCNATAKIPTSCPQCGTVDIIHRGIGTKRIESEIHALFPDAVVARFDGDNSIDTTLEKRYGELYRGDIDIIIGTQVIAKGLDLPRLDTVGIIQADAGIHLPDFIASERTFQLISQVTGRIGRSEMPSRLIVQTYQPTHPAIVYGITQDYASFYQDTLMQRQRNHYPPFSHLLKLTCRYKTESRAIQHAQQLSSRLKSKYGAKITIFGPTPAFYERQREYYRWQLIIKSSQRAHLTEIIAHDIPTKQWQIDLDPLSLL